MDASYEAEGFIKYFTVFDVSKSRGPRAAPVRSEAMVAATTITTSQK